MRKLEYLLSVMLALLVLGGLMVWTQATHSRGDVAISCRPGKAASPVFFKGMNIYPRCPGTKQS